MGEIRVRGADAEAFLERLTPNHVAKLTAGRAHYSGLLTPEGTYIDDLLVYRLEEREFLLVVNAANTAADLRWLESHVEGEVEVEDVSDSYALLALQGPRAGEILAGLTAVDLGQIRYYHFVQGEVGGAAAIVSRTGYTGEDGFELYVAPADAAALWERLLAAGAPVGLQPAGLGARDTLRLEAAMALYGHEIDDRTTPWEAGLHWVVKLAKGDFIGRQALVAQREAGVERRLVGFEVTSRGIARQGHRVLSDDRDLGAVTSGTFSPTFEKALGLAYVPPAASTPGTELSIDVRGRRLGARVVEIPFYRRDE
jgi:aminomethyltransferase